MDINKEIVKNIKEDLNKVFKQNNYNNPNKDGIILVVGKNIVFLMIE